MSSTSEARTKRRPTRTSGAADATAAPGEPTRRDRIILAAGRLFAAKGFHAVTMREIGEAADVPLSLTVYHFATKEALYRSIFDHFHGVFASRLAMLDSVANLGSSDSLAAIVEAFVRPIQRAQSSEDGRIYCLLVLREAADPEQDARGIMRDYYDPLAKRFIAAVQTALPGKSHQSLVWAYLFMVSALVMSVLDVRAQRLSDEPLPPDFPDRKFDSLIQFICAGISGI